MSDDMQSPRPKGRHVSHAAIVCFSVSVIAFVACGMGLFVNHAFTGSLAISGTAAVGLIYLAMGLLNLGYEEDVSTSEVHEAASAPEHLPLAEKVREWPADVDRRFAGRDRSAVSSTHDSALSSHE